MILSIGLSGQKTFTIYYMCRFGGLLQHILVFNYKHTVDSNKLTSLKIAWKPIALKN